MNTKLIGKAEIFGVLTLTGCATTIKDRKILLVRHADVEKPGYGDWLLPAGSAEPGEG